MGVVEILFLETIASSRLVWAYAAESSLEKDLESYYGNESYARNDAPEYLAARTPGYCNPAFDRWIQGSRHHAFLLGEVDGENLPEIDEIQRAYQNSLREA